MPRVVLEAILERSILPLAGHSRRVFPGLAMANPGALVPVEEAHIVATAHSGRCLGRRFPIHQVHGGTDPSARLRSKRVLGRRSFGVGSLVFLLVVGTVDSGLAHDILKFLTHYDTVILSNGALLHQQRRELLRGFLDSLVQFLLQNLQLLFPLVKNACLL